MDFFAHLVANKTSASKIINIRKVYVNEDPNREETEPCPKCMARNHQSTVRYMYVNLQEAIYKCESAFCMYPFQNFKFKNYTDNTVYYYTSAVGETPPALEDFSAPFKNVPSPFKGSHEEQLSIKTNQPIDFDLHFLSPERSHADSKHTDVSPSVNIFDSPSVSYKNLIQDFDTGFIDDILQDLSQSSPEKKPIAAIPVRQNDHSTANRQLKRCLQMFSDSKASTETVFKIPPLPGAEVPSSPKIKPKKPSQLRRSKHGRRAQYAGSSSVEKVAKKSRMKPLEFIESMKRPKAAPAESQLAGVKPLSNQKVERMLNFIERSMKKRESTPEATSAPLEQSPDHSLKQPVKELRTYRKPKRLSLSVAVLQDNQFDYSTSESEQEDTPDSIPSPVKSPVRDPISFSQLPPETDPNQLLPSFEDLLLHIHPTQSAVQPHLNHAPAIGFRSAGSSPTRVQQWEKTPPRRIHSMESLNSLLE